MCYVDTIVKICRETKLLDVLPIEAFREDVVDVFSFVQQITTESKWRIIASNSILHYSIKNLINAINSEKKISIAKKKIIITYDGDKLSENSEEMLLIWYGLVLSGLNYKQLKKDETNTIIIYEYSRIKILAKKLLYVLKSNASKKVKIED